MLRKASLILAVSVLLGACGLREPQPPRRFSPEMTSWTMNTVQSIDEKGKIVARGPESPAEGAPVIDLRCRAEEGALILENRTTGETFFGTWEPADTSPAAAVCGIKVENVPGTAVVSETVSGDTARLTLVLVFDRYSVSFFGDGG